MKKFVWIPTLLVILMTSCTQSSEDKANRIIEEYVKTCLHQPDTYEFIESKIDSAFTPYADPAFHEDIKYLMQYTADLTSIENEIDNEKRATSSAEKSPKMEELTEKEKTIHEKGAVTIQRIQTLLANEPEFIGYQVVHHYRAVTKSGSIFTGKEFLVLDKDLSKILFAYDMDSDAYKLVKEMIRQLKEGEK